MQHHINVSAGQCSVMIDPSNADCSGTPSSLRPDRDCSHFEEWQMQETRWTSLLYWHVSQNGNCNELEYTSHAINLRIRYLNAVFVL